LYAISAATGQQVWSQPADWSDKPVVTDGNTVCIVSQSSDSLWVWAARTGVPSWTTDEDGGIVSATVAAGVVYAVTKNGNLLALGAASRKVLWRQPSSTIITPVVADGVVYAGGPLDGIVARRASDGSQLWRSSSGYFSTTPVVASGVVYAAGPGSAYALRA
jgi:eukaryotic-like serine/threonine-protein kinase